MTETKRGIHLSILVLCVSLLALFILSVLAAHRLVPAWLSGTLAYLTRCPFRMMFDLSCPFCGITSAVVTMAKGDVVESLRGNGLVAFVLPFLMIQVPYRAFRVFRPVFSWREETAVAVFICVAGGAITVIGGWV